MYLLRILDLLALIGLFVQAFVAWVFVAVLASSHERRAGPGAYRSFLWAFVVLAGALTVMSVRFFRAHDVSSSYEVWEDGDLLPQLCYSTYMGLKAWFAWLLVVGVHQLCKRPLARAIRHALGPLVLVMAASPWIEPDIDRLLVVQAPVMIAAAALSVRALHVTRADGTGTRLVRGSLLGLAASWLLHATAVVSDPGWTMNPVLSFNSFIDLGVQLLLGVGLVVCLLEDTHRRREQAEREREQLRQALQEDDKLRALGTVVSGVAHELNNPLTVILGYADVLRRQSPERGPAAIIRDQAERCRGIVRNLSALAGQSVHPREEVELEQLVRRVVSGLPAKATAGERRVHVVPMGGLTGLVDRVGLEQVVANLVGNALQAAPPGSTVTVRATADSAGLDLSVADEGPGVPKDQRERIFEPFFTTKEPGKGTGLGLSIAHAIVRGHGGTITVEEGTGGRGALFRIRLPRTGLRPASARLEEPRPSLERAVLLIVDDDPAVRSVVREAAERRGLCVREAASAEEALVVLGVEGAPIAGRAGEADVILCDLRMSGMGGIGFHDRLLEQRKDLLARVVFFTGDLASPDTVRFSARCERPLIEKPFDFEELFQRLARVREEAARVREEAARGREEAPRAEEPGAGGGGAVPNDAGETETSQDDVRREPGDPLPVRRVNPP